MSLKGKVAVVTGASRGIGRGIALQLGAAGAKVYITGRNAKNKNLTTAQFDQVDPTIPTLEKTVQDITKRGGHGIAVYVDHSNNDQVKALFEKVDQENNGKLDILVNNAFSGLDNDDLLKFKKFWELEPQIWDTLNNVGLRSHYIASVYAARLFVKNGHSGLIVNISSVGAKKFYFTAAFGVGKAAVDRLTADTAIELKPHKVTVVSLWPAQVKTEIMQKAIEEEKLPAEIGILNMPKSYSDEVKTAVILYANKCGVKSASITFKISIATIYTWLKNADEEKIRRNTQRLRVQLCDIQQAPSSSRSQSSAKEKDGYRFNPIGLKYQTYLINTLNELAMNSSGSSTLDSSQTPSLLSSTPISRSENIPTPENELQKSNEKNNSPKRKSTTPLPTPSIKRERIETSQQIFEPEVPEDDDDIQVIAIKPGKRNSGRNPEPFNNPAIHSPTQISTPPTTNPIPNKPIENGIENMEIGNSPLLPQEISRMNWNNGPEKCLEETRLAVYYAQGKIKPIQAFNTFSLPPMKNGINLNDFNMGLKHMANFGNQFGAVSRNEPTKIEYHIHAQNLYLSQQPNMFNPQALSYGFPSNYIDNSYSYVEQPAIQGLLPHPSQNFAILPNENFAMPGILQAPSMPPDITLSKFAYKEAFFSESIKVRILGSGFFNQ
uniref:Uncharacterized protein n=1 Tax=Acrobeloides nanus TaxID=290746 RepID=A0A914DWQ3_9BILA